MPPLPRLVLPLVALLCACAAEVVRHPTELSTAVSPRHLVAAKATVFTLDSGYGRRISEGSEFVELGSIREGRVLKPVRGAFTIEGAHMHEAYPVERDGQLVGFYLPVERAFSPLSRPVELSLQRRPQ